MRDELDEVLDYFNPGPRARSCGDGERADTYDKARAIRDRERKLAGLAHEIARMRTDEHTYEKMKDWNRRYEEALK